MAVPKEFRVSAGVKVVQRSLETTDRREASIRAGELRAKLFGQWRSLPNSHVPTERELEEAAVVIAHDLERESADDGRKTLRGKGPIMWQAHVKYVQSELEIQAQHTATGDFSLVRDLADEAIEALEFDLPRDGVGYTKLCELLNIARLSGLQVSNQRNLGNVEADTDSKLVHKVRTYDAVCAKPGETIMELFEAYANERVAAKTKRLAGVAQDRMVVNLLAEFVGFDRSPASIDYEDAKAFVDAIEKLPSGYKKRGKFRGLDVRQAIEKGQRDGDRPISLITQQRYISTVSPFFKWLASAKGGRRIKDNPFLGLGKDISKLKGARSRPPFTAEQITVIINSPLFTGFIADGKEHRPGPIFANDWRYWLPLFCLFTGARVGEIAQLHVCDIFQDHGVWCVELRDDETTGQRIKNGRTRAVALHTTLISLGLLDFVERRRMQSKKDGNPQLFPEMKAGPREQFGDEPSEWWRSYLTAIGVKAVNGCDGFGIHSFRHTMADQLRAAGHLDYVFGPLILGHSTRSVTGGYGEVQQGTPQQSHELIESVRFVPIERGKIVEGGKPVDFSHLIDAEKARNATLQ